MAQESWDKGSTKTLLKKESKGTTLKSKSKKNKGKKKVSARVESKSLSVKPLDKFTKAAIASAKARRKLTKDQVKQVRSLLFEGKSVSYIVKNTRIPHYTVYAIRSNRVYSDIH